jgi:hypothetical protein
MLLVTEGSRFARVNRLENEVQRVLASRVRHGLVSVL